MATEAGPIGLASAVSAGQIYRNSKRNTRYVVVCLATDSEDDKAMVVYRDVETGRNFVRSLAMFTGTREVNGMAVPRFVLEGDRGEG